ncbi:GGDEF domain-containing protein [Chitinibacter fontanus]|uniref:diguanylate cyclase n=1 Tax=Chitinibacter fontanus TaxID=1737446 RepID=A0A7D5ZEL8_9NEIS|nr:GGDEF domain-containing protein [Chitinibacter fontanus]QLI81664.1 GGDEF domain-containing protein [Chitinibacter fontanus]
MSHDLFSLAAAAMICALLGAGMYLNLARGHHSERGITTLAIGGVIHQSGWLIWALDQFLSNNLISWVAILLLLLGQLGLLAGTRRSFARPAVLGWWAALLPIWLIVMAMSMLQVISESQSTLAQALLLAPLAFQIGREAFLPSNDEDWSFPRWLLVGTTHSLAVVLLLAGFSCIIGAASDIQTSAILASLACLIGLILPYSYQLMISHRLYTRLSKLVRYDALTGLLNRRGMEEHAGRELHRARKHQSSLGLMLIDIDQFRIVNQRYGYGAGDVALKKCAKKMREIAGEDALIGRVAGEEFCVIFTDKDSHTLRTLAVEIEMALQALTIEHGDHSFHVSVTLSLVKYGRHGNQFEALLQRAEEKLQQRKGNLRLEPLPDGAITVAP